jgi:hypothetical protein
MLADALPERAFPPTQNRRRLAAAAIVAVLHFVFLYALLQAISIQAVPRILKEVVPITIWLPQPPKKETEKKKPEPPPAAVAPAEPVIRTAPITVPQIPVRPHSTEDEGFGRLGRYLNNCSAGNYAALTPQEWANCLGGMATRDHNTVTLGQVRTLWELQHPGQAPPNPKEATGFGECAHNDPNRLMGLPCFQHNGEKPSVANGQQ